MYCDLCVVSILHYRSLILTITLTLTARSQQSTHDYIGIRDLKITKAVTNVSNLLAFLQLHIGDYYQCPLPRPLPDKELTRRAPCSVLKMRIQ